MLDILSVLPKGARDHLRSIRDLVYSLFYYGSRRYCPVCERSFRRFGKGGTIQRDDAKCMYCGALERHRFLWLYLNKMTNLFDNKQKKVLHVAPEPCFEKKLRKYLGSNYITADLSDPKAMVQIDITDIKYLDESFDIICCSHVLEHIEDDKKAMRELYRILKKDGWAILLVPITVEKTFEDLSITDPNIRLRIFGQKDHLRCYGPDYVERLREVGFRVKITRVSDLYGENESRRMGLTPASGEIYYCTKQ